MAAMDEAPVRAGSLGRSDARANRERLLTAAAAVFAERGPDAEMKEIADRAGMGVGTVYRNFATKDELVTAVINRQFDSTNAAVEAAAAIEDPVAAVRALLALTFRTVEEQRGLILSMRAGGVPDDCIDPARVRHHLEACTAPFQRGAAAGAFRTDIPPEFLGAYLYGQFGLYLELLASFPADVAARYCTELVMQSVVA